MNGSAGVGIPPAAGEPAFKALAFEALEKNRPPHSACTYATPLVNPDESVRAGAGVVGAGPRTTLTEREIQERREAGEQTHSTCHQRGGSR